MHALGPATRNLVKLMLSAWSKQGFGSVVVTRSRSPEPCHLVILVHVIWTDYQLYASHHGGSPINWLVFFSHRSALRGGVSPVDGEGDRGFKASVAELEPELRSLVPDPGCLPPGFPGKGSHFHPRKVS